MARLSLVESESTNLSQGDPPRPHPDESTGRAALVECPETGRVTRIHITFNPVVRRFAVTDCERFTDGQMACHQECVPSLR